MPIGLGGGQARRFQSRQAALDVPDPERTAGPPYFRALPLLGHLDLLPQQAGGEEPAALPVEPGRNRQADGGRPRLRCAAVREAERLRDMGGSRTA